MDTIDTPTFDVTARPNIFAVGGQKYLVEEGCTISEMVGDANVQVLVNGVEVPVEFYSRIRPRAGTIVHIHQIPRGGGGDKGGLGALLTILAFVALGAIGGILYAAATGATTALVGGIVGGVVGGVVGALVSGGMVPPPAALEGTGNNSFKPATSITGTRNRLNPFGVVPRVYGTHRIFPALAAQPVTELQGNDQYLRQLFCVGYKPLALTELKIGDTDILNFEDVELEIDAGTTGQTDDITLFTSVIDEEGFNILYDDNGNFTVDIVNIRTTDIDTIEVSLDFVAQVGLAAIDDDGDKFTVAQLFTIEHSPAGMGTWTLVDKNTVGATTSNSSLVTDGAEGEVYRVAGRDTKTLRAGIRFPVPEGQHDIRVTRVRRRGGASENSQHKISWTALRSIKASPVTLDTDHFAFVALRLKATDQLNGVVDEFNCVATSHLPTWNGSDWNTVAATANPAAIYRDILLGTANARAVGILTGTDLISNGTFDDATGWTLNNGGSIANGVLFDSTPAAPAANIALTTPSPALISGVTYHAVYTVRNATTGEVRFNVSGSGVQEEPYTAGNGRRLITFTHNGVGSGDVGFDAQNSWDGEIDNFSVTVSRLVESDLQTWYDDEETAGRTFNAVVDSRSTVFNMLKLVASVGRAAFSVRDGKYTIIQDKEQTVPVQLFTPRNMRNFKGSKVFNDIPHGFKVRFTSPDLDWQEDEITVFRDGFDENNATKFETLNLRGITDPDQAFLEGLYQLSVAVLRPEKFTFQTSIEHLVCTRGDLIRIQHDAALIGQKSGRVVSVVGSPVSSITIDEEVSMVLGKSYNLILRKNDGTILTVPVNTNGGTFKTLTLTTPTADIVAGNLFAFGEIETQTQDAIVFSITPSPSLEARVVAVPAAPEIHGILDAASIPVYSPVIEQPLDPTTVAPATPVITDIRSDETVLLQNDDGSFAPQIYLSWEPQTGSRTRVREYQVGFRTYNTDEADEGSKTPAFTEAGEWTRFANLDPDLREAFIVPVDEGRQYDVRLRSVSIFGVESEWAIVAGHVVTGSTNPPPDIDDMRINGELLTWDYDEPIDFEGFKLRAHQGFNRDWDSATPLHEGFVTNNFFDLETAPHGNRTFLLKAFDSGGRESVNAAVLVTNLGDRVSRNLVFEFDDAEAGFTGTVVEGEIDTVPDPDVLQGESLTTFWSGSDASSFWSGTDADDFYQGVFGNVEYIVSFTPPAKFVVPFTDLIFEPTFLNQSVVVQVDVSGDISFWSGNASEIFWTDDANLFWEGAIGPNLVSNGTFDNADDWTLQGGASIAGGVLTDDNSSGAGGETFAIIPTGQTPAELNAGTTYHVTYTVSNTTTGEVRFNMNASTQVEEAYDGTNGTRTFTFVATGLGDGTFTFQARNNWDGDIDDFKVVELGVRKWRFWPGIKRNIKRREFTFRLTAIGGSVQPQSENVVFVVDVPDVIDNLQDIVIQVGGTRLPLTKEFIEIVNVGLTLQEDGGDAVQLRINDRDLSGPLITALDDTMSETTALIDARVQGF